MSNIPRRFWTIWFQGVDKAPFAVRRCVASWQRENPDWEINILDDENLDRFITFTVPEEKLRQLSLREKSDLARLHLLEEYGGVWADPTTYCVKPLDEWIAECTASGFFAYRNPGKDRVIASWFMISERGSPVMVRMRERLAAFFTENNLNNGGRIKKPVIKVLNRLLNRNTATTRYWLSRLVTKGLRVYPYFVLHYIFERLVATDSECQSIWNNTPEVEAYNQQLIGRTGFFAPISSEVKETIKSKKAPMFKLTWKYNHERDYSPNSTMGYLLEGKHL